MFFNLQKGLVCSVDLLDCKALSNCCPNITTVTSLIEAKYTKLEYDAHLPRSDPTGL